MCVSHGEVFAMVARRRGKSCERVRDMQSRRSGIYLWHLEDDRRTAVPHFAHMYLTCCAEQKLQRHLPRRTLFDRRLNKRSCRYTERSYLVLNISSKTMPRMLSLKHINERMHCSQTVVCFTIDIHGTFGKKTPTLCARKVCFT